MHDESAAATKHSFSIIHAETASSLAKMAAQTEVPDPSGKLPPTHSEHRAFVIATVMTSVAMLEAAINEFFSDCGSGTLTSSGLAHDRLRTAQYLADGRHSDLERYPVLKKFDSGLIIFGKDPFNHGAQPFQDANLLITLRNTLVHAGYVENVIQSDIPSIPLTQHELDKKLSGKFPPNALYAHSINPYFPDKCLSAGCARWAFRSSIALADDFFSRLGLNAPYEHIRGNFILRTHPFCCRKSTMTRSSLR